MELLNVVKARSIWLFDINDLNPRGKSINTELIEWLKGAYGFGKVPSTIYDLDDTKALAFLNGQFQVKDELFLECDLRIYNDGVVADTRSSTKDTDALMKDLLTSAAKEFGLTYKPEIIHTRQYLSELNVRCIRPLQSLHPQLAAFATKLSSLTGSRNNFELTGILFTSESMPTLAMGPFRFERKLGVPLSENRYYSIAPLQTEEHFDLLEELESILV